ncbi:MAG: cyclic nucleotide-binding domain-containing protein [Mariprofundaceae bacterium]|nr:cyclic nucleotide-binding domain-containing protein [Mariprofundaceae bacterium]
MSNEFLELSGIHGESAERESLTGEEFPILKGLSPLSLRILNRAGRVMNVSKGVEMLHEGDTPHDLYFIKRGKMAICRQSGTQLKVIAQLGAGEIYGEFGALRKKSRYASVYTAEPSVIVRVELSAVQQVLEADSNFRNRLEALLTQRMLSSFFFSHPVFHALPEKERSELARELPVQSYERNRRIFSQGKAPQGIYLVLSGEVEISYRTRSKEERLLEIRRDNDVLGEVANKNGTELAYSAVAVSDVDLLVLDKAAMKTLHDRHPESFKNLEAYINKHSERTVLRLKENME